MDDDSLLPFALPAICRKKVSVAFDGGRLSSDGGVLVLRDGEGRLEVGEGLAGCVADRRDPSRIEHEMVEMLRLRMFLIAAGYEDGDDCDALRSDPVFKLAVGRLPETAPALCSQPTMSRLENTPSKIELARMMAAMIDLFCASWDRLPEAITLDIDDTPELVEGRPGARLPATVAVQRPLRRALFPADPHLRGGERQARGRHPPAGKDAGRRRGPRHRQARGPAASAGTGRRPASAGAATAITPVPRRWTGARPMASTMSSGSPETTCCTRRYELRPTICACAAPRPATTSAGPGPSFATPPRAGPRSAASSPGSRPRPAASMPVTSLPPSRTLPSPSTRRSTARAARPRISSSCTRPNSPPTAPRAAAHAPISSG